MTSSDLRSSRTRCPGRSALRTHRRRTRQRERRTVVGASGVLTYAAGRAEPHVRLYITLVIDSLENDPPIDVKSCTPSEGLSPRS